MKIKKMQYINTCFLIAFSFLQTSNSVDIEDFEEVDLSQLEFDENIYDQQWAIRTNIRPPNLPSPSTPTHRSHSAGVVRPSLNSPSKATSLVMDDSAAQKLHSEVNAKWRQSAFFSDYVEAIVIVITSILCMIVITSLISCN